VKGSHGCGLPSSSLLPGTRVACSVTRRGWRLPSVRHEPAETRLHHRSAKSSDFERIEVPSTVSELTPEDCSSCANPTPAHAARHFRERALQLDIAPS